MKIRGRHSSAAVLPGKTPRRDQNPVLAISSFGQIKSTRNTIIFTAKHPRARLAAGRRKTRWYHPKATAFHGKTPGRDQNPVLAISSFGPIKSTRNAIIFTAKHPRARLSSGRSEQRVDDVRGVGPSPRYTSALYQDPTPRQVRRHDSWSSRWFTWLHERRV
jgi:hypothetical protein